VFYEQYFIKALEGREISREEAPPALKKIWEILEASNVIKGIGVKAFIVGRKPLILGGCGGFKKMKNMLREILTRENLHEIIDMGLYKIVLISDADKDVWGSVEGILTSIGLKYSREGDFFRVEIDGRELLLTCAKQGLESKGETGQLEDIIDKWLLNVHPEFRRAIRAFEEILNMEFNSKMKAGIYAAILASDQSKHKLIVRLFKESKRGEIKQLHSLLKDVNKALYLNNS